MSGFDAYFLEDQEGLTHYMRTTHFATLLANSQLYLRRQDLQSDLADGKHSPTSGMHPFDTALVGEGNQTLQNSYRMLAEVDRKRTYLHCWTRRPNEHAEMWTGYGLSGAGVCLVSTVGRIRAALGITEFPGRCFTPDGLMSVELLGANYESNSTPSQTWPSSLVTARKEAGQFRAEEEARVVGRLSGDSTSPGAEFQGVPVDIQTLISAVIVGSRVDPHEYDNLLRSIVARNPEIAVRRSDF